MSQSQQEIHEDYQAGLISDENMQKWEEFFSRNNDLSVRIDTVDATEYRVSDTQNKDADTRPMTAFESMVAGLIDLGWPVFVLALIVLDFIF